MANLLIFGAGYSGLAIAAAGLEAGLSVSVTSRGRIALPRGAVLVAFESAAPAIAAADYLVSTAAPDGHGDPVLAHWGAEIASGPARWLGYLSTTGVYGDRGGGWVDESTPPKPGADRSRRRRVNVRGHRRGDGQQIVKANRATTAKMLEAYAKTTISPNQQRMFYPERLRAADIQPLIDASAKYGVLKAAFPAKDMFAPGIGS